jgi:hypothetical protein
MLIVFDNIVDMVTGSAFSILTGDVEHSIPAITVTGKAFFDVGHSLKDQRSDRKSHLPGYSAWKIHPAVKILVND